MSKRRYSSSRHSQVTNKQWITLVMAGIAAIFGLIFLFTDVDPLGLFSPTPVAPGGSDIQESGDGWWQVYFTVPDRLKDPSDLKGSIPEKLIAYIDSAQGSIDLAAFEFDLEPVAQALLAAHRRGVVIRWITDDEYGIMADQEDGVGLFTKLKEAGIQVQDDDRSALMHNKFLIFDRQTVWTGSTNLTYNDNFLNNNNVIVINSRGLAAIYEREFEEMWAGEHGPKSPSTIQQQSLNIDGTSLQVFFASEDKVISQIIPLVKNAGRSLHIMAFSFTQNDLTEAVLERSKAGVPVQAIFETRGSKTIYSALRPFYCAGLSVRQDGNPRTFHHKVIIIDGKIVITGSLNFSENADGSNDENTLVLTNSDIAVQYLSEFNRRWLEATPPDLSLTGCD